MNKLRLISACLLAGGALTMSAAAPDFKTYVNPNYNEKTEEGTCPTYDAFLSGVMADNGVGVLTYIYEGITLELNQDCTQPAKLLRADETEPIAELTTTMLWEGSMTDPGIDFWPSQNYICFLFKNFYSGDPSMTINSPGVYQAVYPAGFFLINGEESAESVFTYYIGEGLYKPGDESTIDLGFRNEYTTDEGWTGIVFEPYSATLLNTEIEGVSDGCQDPIVVYGDMLTEYAEIYVTDVKLTEVDGKRSFFLPFETPINEVGEYWVVIPEGFWRLGEDEIISLSPDNSLTVTLSQTNKVIYTADNNDVKANLNSLLFTVNGEIDAVDDALKVTVRKNTSMTTLGEFNVTLTENKRGFVLMPKEELNLASGKYIVTLPAGLITITVDGEPIKSDVTNILYQVDTTLGVAGIENESATVTVVTATGVVLFRDATKEVLKTLTPGFYIVNGNKMMVK